ncbi:invasion associated locus B family protein [Ochrobactrum soli]|uniref:Invasion associated locus B family protein n=1 Tax=Ochrobactrum soli TaxID=2448455 RepID=A0A849KXW0_9HYPH|nr:invasion associated locus B family protein [[Ochrobactrum] soli]NNU63608.1 invasion associated locus B family protein [[Ochrobactrum] soli]
MWQFRLALTFLLLLGGVASAQQPSATLRIKEAEVRLPDGVQPGQYRRIIQPFENWTLICDENLQKKTRVCNVTQAIIDQSNRMVFSWSVAATQDGKPYMIVRTLPGIGDKGTVVLTILDDRAPVRVSVDGCNDIVCVGTVPIGPRFKPQIDKGATVGIFYKTMSGEAIDITAPLAGISSALKAIE